MAIAHHTHIATEGMLGDHTLIALMGFGWGIEIVVPPEYVSGGGGIGGGWAQSGTGRHVSPPRVNLPKTVPVTVKVTLAGKTTKRTFVIRTSRYKHIVKVTDIINASLSHVQVGITNIKRGAARLINVLFSDK